MKRLTNLLALIVVPLLPLSPAHADWQYTKWGMSVEQVIRASGGQLRLPTPQERSAGECCGGVMPGLVGLYRTPTLVFSCLLYFPSQASD